MNGEWGGVAGSAPGPCLTERGSHRVDEGLECVLVNWFAWEKKKKSTRCQRWATIVPFVLQRGAVVLQLKTSGCLVSLWPLARRRSRRGYSMSLESAYNGLKPPPPPPPPQHRACEPLCRSSVCIDPPIRPPSPSPFAPHHQHTAKVPGLNGSLKT